jgi:hypothetical protein
MLKSRAQMVDYGVNMGQQWNDRTAQATGVSKKSTINTNIVLIKTIQRAEDEISRGR